MDWNNFTAEDYEELLWQLLENAIHSYQSDREDIEAWIAGGVATIMFDDVCKTLDITSADAMRMIRGEEAA